jgi:hypothetical protein
MKLLCVTTFLLILYGSISCNKKKDDSHILLQSAVLSDRTDPHTLQPLAQAVVQNMQITKYQNASMTFYISAITDKVMNEMKELHLGSNNATEKANVTNDPQYRKKLVVAFVRRIPSTIDTFMYMHKEIISLSHSECFRAIAGMVTKMQAHQNSINSLWVYSDLQENSDLFSAYSKQGKKVIETAPEKLTAIFESTHLLPDSLSNLTVYFMYNPETREKDIAYRRVVDVYKSVFEKRAAKVIITSSNKIYNNE